MNNVSKINDCYGCGVCATVCAKKIIEIRLNENGFYRPFIKDNNLCSDCGLCMEVCAYSHAKKSIDTSPIHSYAAWSNDEQVRYRCSSGGISYEIGKYLLQHGYSFCGVRYDVNEERAEHYIAKTLEELYSSLGSKYIQSYTLDAFKAINLKEKYLVVGTPCQIDSFRRYVQRYHKEQNFVLMDFFCHGVPSMWMWRNYLASVKEKVGDISDISWRDKKYGWHSSWVMKARGEKGIYYSPRAEGDMFYRYYLSDWCINPACCGKCKYKYDSSSADIRVCDLWGSRFACDEKGVSGLVSFTKVGDEIINNISSCHLEELPFEIVAEMQMKNNTVKPPIYPIVRWLLNRRKKISVEAIYRLTKLNVFLNVPSILCQKIKNKL